MQADYEMIARILCRLGLHSWKPVLSAKKEFSFGYLWADWFFPKIGRKCRRCGKRVAL